MLRFNFILCLNLPFLLLKVLIIYYHTPKHGEITFEASKKLSYSIYNEHDKDKEAAVL